MLIPQPFALPPSVPTAVGKGIHNIAPMRLCGYAARGRAVPFMLRPADRRLKHCPTDLSTRARAGKFFQQQQGLQAAVGALAV